MFCRPDGTPYDLERFSLEFRRNQDYFKRENPLPELTLHGLRHTSATLALRAGMDIKIVSERLNQHPHHEGDLHPTSPRRCRLTQLKGSQRSWGSPRASCSARQMDHKALVRPG